MKCGHLWWFILLHGKDCRTKLTGNFIHLMALCNIFNLIALLNAIATLLKSSLSAFEYMQYPADYLCSCLRSSLALWFRTVSLSMCWLSCWSHYGFKKHLNQAKPMVVLHLSKNYIFCSKTICLRLIYWAKGRKFSCSFFTLKNLSTLWRSYAVF